MSTDRLRIYNGALIICGERTLANLTENREGRYLLDEVWNDNGVRYCLEQGQWKFAMRSSQLVYNPSLSPDFGFKRGFTKPTDWVATSAVCSDEFFKTPLLEYVDEVGFWFSDLDTIYVRYVSDHVAFGGDLAKWTSTFTDYVKSYFASRIVFKISKDTQARNDVFKLAKHNLMVAKNKDAMAGPAKFPPQGNWVQSRFGRINQNDGGNRSGNLIG